MTTQKVGNNAEREVYKWYLLFSDNGKLEVSTNDPIMATDAYIGTNDDTIIAALPHVILLDGEVQIDTAAQAAAAAEREHKERIVAIKNRMAELDYDINACEDGVVKALTVDEYRAERIALRNELRQLEGKEPLQTWSNTCNTP